MTRPIAVISASIRSAENFLYQLPNIKKVNRANRTVTTMDDKVYEIITEINHMRGMEYSKVLEAPRAWENSNYEELMAYAKLRVRKEE